MADNNRTFAWALVAVLIVAAVLGWWQYFDLEQTASQADADFQEQRTEQLVKLAAADDRVKGLQAELDNLRSTANEFQQSSQDQKVKHQEIVTELETANQRLAAIDQELISAQQDNERLSQQLLQLQTERDQVGEKLQESTAENESLRQQVAQADAQLSAAGLKLRQTSEEMSALENTLAELEAGRARENVAFDKLQAALQSQLNNKDIEIKRMQNQQTVIRMGSDILFNSGSADLSVDGKKALRLIADTLKNYPDRLIQIEGHTDNLPIGSALKATYPSNWELSSARAARAVRYLHAAGIDPEGMQVVGYGQYRPVTGNDSTERREKNRRIEITLMPSRAENAASD